MQEMPTLRDGFSGYLQRHGYLPAQSEAPIREAIQKIYLEPEPESPIRSCCELLIRFDELVQLWRFRHVQMVERMIGTKPGTGGSMGVPYLRATLSKRFFPELWEARTFL
jgi:tryptophan 2,3-dioxygenase